MNQREKTLLIAVLSLVGLLVLRELYGRYTGALAAKEETLTAAQDELTQIKRQLTIGRRAVDDLTRWREQSLPNVDPNDPISRELATTLYNQWLSNTLKMSGVEFDRIDPSPPSRLVSQSIGTVGFSVNVEGSLTSLVGFLHRFYTAPQLQQITWLDLRPVGGNLQGTLRVEALLLPGATHTEEMPSGTRDPFLLTDLDSYRTSVGGRNIFERFQRPSRPDEPVIVDVTEPEPEPPFDDSKFALFTGAVHGSEGLVAWITVQTTGQTLFRSEGDAIDVGEFSAKVISIEPRAIVIETEQGQLRVNIGDSLHDGKPI